MLILSDPYIGRILSKPFLCRCVLVGRNFRVRHTRITTYAFMILYCTVSIASIDSMCRFAERPIENRNGVFFMCCMCACAYKEYV